MTSVSKSDKNSSVKAELSGGLGSAHATAADIIILHARHAARISIFFRPQRKLQSLEKGKREQQRQENHGYRLLMKRGRFREVSEDTLMSVVP